MTGCEENFIIYLTDGAATADSSDPGYTTKMYKDKTGLPKVCYSIGSENDESSESCLDELAFLMHNYDVNPGIAGEQTVRTFTVGFFVDNELLETTADLGGGKYYIANSHDQLKDAIKDAMSTIKVLAVNSSFTIPAVTVNSFNRVSHLDDLFFSLFKPGETRHWAGNLKKFRLKKNAAGDVEIVDRNGMPAVEPLAGFFKDDITSFWTTSGPDGGETEKGGAAERLGQISERRVYTWIGPDMGLTATSNQLGSTNGAITNAMVGAATATERTAILKWAQGVDVKDEDGDGLFSDLRPTMGDPLHAAPVTVMYGTKANPEGEGTIPDYTVYTATNDGYLHAFDGNDGNELFAFVPPELLGNLGEVFKETTGGKLYGLDGFVVPLVKHDATGSITGTDSHAHLVIGMRRGGNNYYALDVTDRNAPRLLWRIKGGEGDFKYLAQSWAEPIPAKVNIAGSVRDVLVIGGGYDEDQDDHDNDYMQDDTGTAIYMVDAATGNRLWWAGPAGSGADLEVDAFRNSMPATVTVLDMNNDGYSDRWYVPDTGGRIFRFDIMNGKMPSALVRGGKIATLGAGDLASPTAADTRKFFYPIDVSRHNGDDGQWLNLAIGSGNRTSPLDTTVKNRFYVLRDEHVYTVPSDYAAAYDIGVEDLFDATATTVDNAVIISNKQRGWYIDLADEGEKVLAESVTYDGKLVFTTFSPSDGTNASCEADLGKGRVYAMNINSAEAVRNFDIIQEDSEEAFTVEDRSTELERSGIPPAMTIVFAEDNEGRPIGLVGPETVDVDLGDNVVRTYWYRSSK